MEGSPEDNMHRIWALVSQYYTAHKVSTQFSNLSLASFTDKDKPRTEYPVLKGRGLAIKDLVGPLCHAWEVFRCGTTYEYEAIKDLLGHQYAMISILKENAGNLFLPDDDGIQFRRHTDQFLNCYTALARQADIDGWYLWKLVPKVHWLWHLADKSRFLNPRANACMLDEDPIRACTYVVCCCR